MSASTTLGNVPGRCSFLRRFSTAPSVFEVAQHLLQRGAVGIFQAEGAGDLAGADFPAFLGDEGDQVLPRGQEDGWRLRTQWGSGIMVTILT